MRLRNFLFLLAFTSIVFGSPTYASETEGTPDSHAESGDQHDSHAESGHQGGHEINWFDFSHEETPPLIALLINFAVLVTLVYILLRKSLTNRFKNRKETLVAEIEEAKKMKAAAETALKEARAQMDSLDAEMAKVKESILGAGKAESAKILQDAKATGERLSADAMAMVEQEIARISQEIRQEIVEEVIAIAEKLVREKINASDQERIFGEYLSGLGSDPGSKDLDRGVGQPDGEAR